MTDHKYEWVWMGEFREPEVGEWFIPHGLEDGGVLGPAQLVRQRITEAPPFPRGRRQILRRVDVTEREEAIRRAERVLGLCWDVLRRPTSPPPHAGLDEECRVARELLLALLPPEKPPSLKGACDRLLRELRCEAIMFNDLKGMADRLEAAMKEANL